MLNEITSALDQECTVEALDVVRGRAARGMTTLIVTHQPGFTRDAGLYVVVMDRGG